MAVNPPPAVNLPLAVNPPPAVNHPPAVNLPLVVNLPLAVNPPPAAVAAPGIPIRLFFTWPLMRANPLIHLATPSLRALIALVQAEYADVVGVVEAASVDWDARFTKGIAMRYDRKDGGAGCCVLRSDADLEACWAVVEFAEAFIGDRRGAP